MCAARGVYDGGTDVEVHDFLTLIAFVQSNPDAVVYVTDKGKLQDVHPWTAHGRCQVGYFDSSTNNHRWKMLSKLDYYVFRNSEHMNSEVFRQRNDCGLCRKKLRANI